MKLEEKRTLLRIFSNEQSWCKHAEARDRRGNPVKYDDASAVSWDLVGGMCHAFGWKRASQLFAEMWNFDNAPSRRYWTRQDKAYMAMAKMMDFNDHAETSFLNIVARIKDIKPWRAAVARIT